MRMNKSILGYNLRREVERRKCFNFERMPTNLETLFSTLFMLEMKFKCESIITSKYFALSHDNTAILVSY